MIVIDASGTVEALVGRDADGELLNGLAGEVSAPHLLDVEVLSALRGLLRAGKLEPARAEQARRDHFDLRTCLELEEFRAICRNLWCGCRTSLSE